MTRSRRTRWALAAAVALAGAALVALLAAATPTDSKAEAGAVQLPDLRQVVPSGLEVRRASRGRVVLAFASAVENVGAGPLLVRGMREPGEARMRADQLVSRVDAARQTRVGIGTLRYVPGGHNHWHLAGFQRFELRDPATGRRVARDNKTGFCLGDRFRARGRAPGWAAAPVINHNCSRGLPGAPRILMGITPGWGDDYAAYLEDQFVEITGVPAGRYVLVHRADPSERLAVGDRKDDVASALIELGRPGDSGLPAVRVLAGCPARDGSPERPCTG